MSHQRNRVRLRENGALGWIECEEDGYYKIRGFDDGRSSGWYLREQFDHYVMVMDRGGILNDERIDFNAYSGYVGKAGQRRLFYYHVADYKGGLQTWIYREDLDWFRSLSKEQYAELMDGKVKQMA